MSLDSRNTGKLQPSELLEFFRSIPTVRLTSQQLRYLIFHVTEMEHEGHGRISWQVGEEKEEEEEEKE